MKKLRNVEITNDYVKQRYNEDVLQIDTRYSYAKDLYNYRKHLCEESNCDNHYEIVQVKIENDSEVYYGVVDITNNRLL